MRNLKKFLAVLVVVALMATSMVPAFAADQDELSAIDVVTGLGIIEGDGNGVDEVYLAKNTTRIQAVIVLLKAYGLYEEAAAFEGTENFADADTVTWAEGRRVLAYLKAHPELGWVGNPDGTFAPYDYAEPAQLYKVMLQLLGYEYGVDYTWSEVLDKAVEFGMAGEYGEGQYITNEAMIGIIYEGLITPVKGSEDILLVALAEINESIREKALELGLIEEVPAEITATAAATGAYKLTVTFNQPVDTKKATFSVKKGSTSLNIKEVTFDEDNESATIELTGKITEGKYTITVSGLTEEAITLTVEAENEEIAKIEFPSDKAPLGSASDRDDDRYATTRVKIYNQYDEDVTDRLESQVTFTVGKGSFVSSTDGLVLLDAGSGNEYKVDDKIAISALDAESGTFATTVLTVSAKSQVADIEIVKLYNEDDEDLVAGEANPEEWMLVVKAYDQYGNEITTPAWVSSDVIVTSSKTTVADFAKSGSGSSQVPAFTTEEIDDETEIVLPLAGTIDDGTTVFTILSKTTGRNAKFELTVKEAVVVDVLELSAPDVAVAGEDIEIPFVAIDQFGEEVTDADILNSTVDLGVSGDAALTDSDIRFEQDYVKDAAKLLVDTAGVTDEKTIVVTAITGTNKVYQLRIPLVEAAVPDVVAGVDDLVKVMAVGGEVEIDEEDIIVNDQHGRELDHSNFTLGAGNYRYVISTSNDAKVDVNGGETAYITTSGATVTLSGIAKGSATITIKLQKWDSGAWEDVTNSAYTYTAKVVEKADIASYEVADFGLLYEVGGSDYWQDLEVYGLLSDGTKVAIPNTTEYYSVVINDDYVTYYNDGTTNAVYSVYGYDWDDDKTRDVAVIVTVKGAKGNQVVVKTITVSNEAPKITTLEMEDDDTYAWGEVANGVVYADIDYLDNEAELEAIVQDVVKALDQYGVENTSEDYVSVSFTNTTDAEADLYSELEEGDKLEVVAVTSTGKFIKFNLVVID